jgi:hypothetical protein
MCTCNVKFKEASRLSFKTGNSGTARCNDSGLVLCIDGVRSETGGGSAAPVRRGNWLLDVSHRPFAPQHAGAGLTDIARSVRKAFPDGVDRIVIQEAAVTGWRVLADARQPDDLTQAGRASVAILIGLLLPAVQKIREASLRNLGVHSLKAMMLGTRHMGGPHLHRDVYVTAPTGHAAKNRTGGVVTEHVHYQYELVQS